MDNTVSFRDFEERDIDFIYKCKNDEKLNSMIVGQFHPYTYEEAAKWVHGCMGEHETYKFWAVCTNDEEKRIVGWVSLSEIDKKKAFFHGIVIADPNYRDGFAWIESYLFIYDYAFSILGVEKVYGKARTDHLLSQSLRHAMFAETINLEKNALYSGGQYHDISEGMLSRDEYLKHKENGDYELPVIIKRLIAIKKQMKKVNVSL